MHCKSLHTLPKFAATTQRIQVGNGQCISVLFTIPVIIEIHIHRFEIYTLVSEIYENVDLVLGIKNVFELEGVINSRDCRFEFLNRSVPIYPDKEIILKLDEQKLVKVKALFIDEISGLAHSQAKTSGNKLLEVHRVRKELDSNLRAEKQHAMPKKGMTEKTHIGQGRAGVRRR